uniref:DNA-directed RNA polymerase subunit beta n=1 Tax=Anthurium amnicola TaxID=1678845 RepID=A0A1D1Y5E6_9ARAE
MAAEQLEERVMPADSSSSPPRHPPQFLEVECKSSGKVRRFAAGTEAGYALYLVNRKLDLGLPQALYIEAVKEGEEPVNFGPNAALVNYGQGWRLQTFTEDDLGEMKRMKTRPKSFNASNAADPRETEKRISKSSSNSSLVYIGKILLAFFILFILGGTLTLFLENLPTMISFIFPST